MSLRGLEMLLALIGCLLFFGFVSGTLTFGHVLWATAGVTTILAVTSLVMGSLFPYTRETHRWQRFTEQVGHLELHSRGGARPPSVSGRVGRCHVTISHVEREHLVVMSVPDSPANLAHHDITLELRSNDNRDAPSLSLGDPTFDPRVVLRGGLPEVVAVFDAKARATTLLMMTSDAVEVRKRQIMRFGRRLEINPEGTWRSLSSMADLAEHLFIVSPADIKERLLENATNDPYPKVRALNLRLLFEYYPPDQRVLMLARSSLTSGGPELNLAAASGLAEVGDAVDRTRTFHWLVSQTECVDPDFSGSAIDILSIHYPDQARPILRELESKNGPLPSALLPALVRAGIEPDLERMIERAKLSDDRVKLEIARRLPEHGSRLERLATALLEGSPEEVQLELIEGLIRTGTVDAVEHILPLTKGLLRSKRLRDRAELAIRAIQSKLSHSDSGQLSLSDIDRGELSIEGDRGALSPLKRGGRES